MTLHQLRKPIKPALYSLLFILAATASLIFSLQTLLDGLLLENSRDQYAYVVTAYPKGAAAAEGYNNVMLEPISHEVMEHLEGSEHVSDVHRVRVRAGKITNCATVPDWMMGTESLSQHFFIEGTVIYDNPPPTPKPGSEPSEDEITPFYGMMTVLLDKQWGGDFIKRNSMVVYIARMSDEKIYESGDRVFLVGDYLTQYGAVRTDAMEVFSARARENLLNEELGVLQKGAIFEIPKDVQNTESYILKQMEKNGMLPLYQAYEQLNGAVTVRCVSDMAQLPYVAKGKLYTPYGRLLVESDVGKKVCVVSQALMLRNRLTIGDTVSLSLADGCYAIAQGDDNAGWLSGFPREEEAILNYAPSEDYEIVGIYHQLGRESTDPFCCGVSDVFIPEKSVQTENRPYTVSFRIPGDGYEAFAAETEEFLDEKGYRLMTVDNGWEDVADSFYAMQDRLVLTAMCAGLCFFVAALSYGGLIFQHYRQEYALSRLLGAYRREARKVYFVGFLLSGVPGVLVSVGATQLIYIKWLRERTREAAAIMMPTDVQTLVLLLVGAAVILMVAAVFMLVLICRSERKGILRMI